MLIKKPHGFNNLQMNMESVDTTLLESRIKMYSQDKPCLFAIKINKGTGMSKSENPFVNFLPQFPSLLPVVSGT